MTTPKSAYDRLIAELPFRPTTGQEGFVYRLSEFLTEDNIGKVFLLRGYAGTGKTSMVISVVQTLKSMKRKYALLAPTGRAAKVLAAYTRQRAFTIHKFIYQITTNQFGNIRFSLRHNRGKNAVIIVDEASMISLSRDAGSGRIQSKNLLSDLMKFMEEGKNCKLILIGDTAQLPPVGSADSPALDSKVLQTNFNFQWEMQHELREVVRQDADSGILINATNLRNLLLTGKSDIELNVDFPDVKVIDLLDFEDELSAAYSFYGDDCAMVITRSNKSANQFNQQIRLRIKYMEDEIASTDKLMVVKNNYHWLPKGSSAGFIANGDMVEIMRLGSVEEAHGFRFANTTVSLMDYPNEDSLDVKLLLNTLHVEAPSLPDADYEQLYNSVAAGYAHIPTASEQAKKIATDPYLNALQIKFGYAITCHKAQGGQWPAVFVDQGYLTAEMLGTDYVRWLYTAITRASEKLCLVNFNEQFIAQPPE
ncbi:MAG: AAA family ATPase [Flavobacteriales bacterium]|nr:AAA family ATPase [Flavobacteriales bacterium]